MWTLNQLIRRTSRLAKVTDDLFVNGDSKDGAYLTDTDAKNLKNDIIDSLNTIISTTARVYGLLTYTENVIGSTIDTSMFERTFMKVKRVKDQYDIDVTYKQGDEGKINLVNVEDTDVSTLTYYYLPEEMTSDSDECEVPENMADPVMFCNYAAFEILAAKEDSKSAKRAQIQLDLYNDKLIHVTGNVSEEDIAEEVW